MSIDIGSKIRRLRVKNGLTQEDLANRCELSKGFISQIERDLTSPSIATLVDILECLGTSLPHFFEDDQDEQVVFEAEDTFLQLDEESLQGSIRWLVPNAQKNDMEPILVTLGPGGSTHVDDPHEGEEFGYVLSGSILLHLGERQLRVKRASSFCFRPNQPHFISNPGKAEAKVLWVATPPSF